MARPAGAHTAYRLDGPGGETDEVVIFASEVNALRHAVAATPPMKYVYWPFGMTLTEAIRTHSEPAPRAPRAPRSPKKPAVESLDPVSA